MKTDDQKIEEAAKSHAKEYEDLGESVTEAAEFDFKAGYKRAIKDVLTFLDCHDTHSDSGLQHEIESRFGKGEV